MCRSVIPGMAGIYAFQYLGNTESFLACCWGCPKAVAGRDVSGRGRRNFFSGLVMLPRCVRKHRFALRAAGQRGASFCTLGVQAAGKQTMPGSVGQLATPARNAPARSRLRFGREGCSTGSPRQAETESIHARGAGGEPPARRRHSQSPLSHSPPGAGVKRMRTMRRRSTLSTLNTPSLRGTSSPGSRTRPVWARRKPAMVV